MPICIWKNISEMGKTNMCILCYFEPNAEINPQDLVNGCNANRDGFGFSILKSSGEIITEKSMDAINLIDRFLDLRAMNPNSHSIFHARIATAGEINLENCHPFQIGKMNAVIGHNGHLPIQIGKNDLRSDSRIFAESLLPKKIHALDDFKGFDKIQRWAGSSKLVILNGDSKLKNPVYFINEHLGHWVNGAWFSNWSYCEFDFGYPYSLQSAWDEFCPVCFSKIGDDSWDMGFCELCESCLDCMSDFEDCMCYTKAKYSGWEINPVIGGSELGMGNLW
jgi:hypothetical protein